MIHASSQKPTRKVYDENERKEKNDDRVNFFVVEGGTYKAVSEEWQN